MIENEKPMTKEEYETMHRQKYYLWEQLVINAIEEALKEKRKIIFHLSDEPNVRRSEENILKQYPLIEATIK